MKRLTGLVVVACTLLAVPLAAQTSVSEPHSMWFATPCDWTCALAALATAKGDRSVFVLPTNSGDHPWIILKRQQIGSVEGPIDNTFHVESFSAVAEASARYSSLDVMRAPILVTTTDGGMLVISLNSPQTRRRAVSR